MTTKTKDAEVLEQGNVPAMPEDSFLTIFQVSTEKGYEPAFIEKMMELQERNDANNARKAYHVAMAAFKANPPDIEKNQHVEYSTSKGVTAYDHADLANVTGQINKSLSEYGLSSGWKTTQANGAITVTCTITHIMGHHESTELTSAPDDSGGKNKIQAIGSAITYLERYTILSLTGLATREQDDDGRKSEDVPYITEAQVKTLKTGLAEKGIKEGRITKFMGVETLEGILAKDYGKAMASIEATPAKASDRAPGEEG